MAGGQKPFSAEPSPSGGQFLLQLLQKPPSTTPSPQSDLSPHPHSHSHLHDPAVAAVGPSHPFPPWPTDLRPPLSDPRFAPSPYSFSPVFPQNPWPLPSFDLRNPNFPPPNPNPNPNPPFNSFPHFGFPRNGDPAPPPHHHQIPPFLPHLLINDGILPDNSTTLTFGSLKCEIRAPNALPNGNSTDSKFNSTDSKFQPWRGPAKEPAAPGRSSRAPPIRPHEKGPGAPWQRPSSGGAQRPGLMENRRLPPPPIGHSRRPKGPEQWASANGRRDGEHGLEKRDFSMKLPLTAQLHKPGPPTGSNLHSVSRADLEERVTNLRGEVLADGRSSSGFRRRIGITNPEDGRDIEEDISSLMLEDEEANRNAAKKKNGSRGKDLRSDSSRGLQVSSQRMRNRRKEIACRSDIERLTPCFLSIYESLIPPDEEKEKQKQLLASLEKLVNKEWPGAQLFLYGSCANTFGVSNSDIDVCMTLDDAGTSKSDILLKLAEILESDNLQNVQALTRARVPIVKLMDPVTKISCDICINNVLALVNTKLLRDYAQIDVRLRQLAFIVKHWAKSRGVNETYHGTLSSYAYVLMCIHFLQSRRPAILPCLQGMKATYVVNIDSVDYAYFDRVEELHDFGAVNNESIGYLLWAFFDYWAYCHDYANDVISVRTAGIISKREKDWTRRIGNDRHLICIEDPFEVNHDLGRVVDKYSIKILREEFERAADVLQYDPNPSVKLFEPYVSS
eukprot:TRINITY_DN904_c1_g2_i1.p1 TRINITY_DN904_c1_g2~~TRINITY_DN904_c1_g2_i1.p1  ORF type:complete len:731 (+),score=99.39 TRINITY_DN904_c1_g2_i1:252-2444(+)